MKLFSGHRENSSSDYVIIFCVFFLVVFGLIFLTSASSDLGQIKFGDSYFYLKHQIIYGLLLGIAGFWIASKFYYKYYQNFAIPLMLFSFLLLVLIFTPLGVTAGGATRWLALGPIVFQPAEILKIALIIYIASWLSNRSFRQQSFFGDFVPFLIIIGMASMLLILQPTTSIAAILVLTALIIYFASGAKISYIFTAFLLGFAAFLVISYSTPYRWERIKSFINPNVNIQSSSYQINQALIAIGSGGVSGVGFGKSTTKLYYLPQPIDDSIFAIIAEELGFVGVSFLLLLFVVLILRVFLLSKKINDKFGQLLLVGFGSLIALQAFIHIGAISGILPLTGVPLPFVSYGGTALAVFMTISGIMVNISKYA